MDKQEDKDILDKNKESMKSMQSGTLNRRISLLGPPGAGKGTQARIMSNQWSLPSYSAGGIFREMAREDTEIGRRIDKFISEGKFVPDEIGVDAIDSSVSECKQGFILDGFPRSKSQQKKTTLDFDRVVVLKVSKDEVLRRLTGRLNCKSCKSVFHEEFNPPAKEGVCDHCSGPLYQREDDQPDAIQKRLDLYRNETEPVIDFYRKQEILVKINGEQSPEQVFSSISQRLGVKACR